MSRSSEEQYNRDFCKIERTIGILEEVSDKRHIYELIQEFSRKYTFIEHTPKLRKDKMYLMNLLNEKEYELKDECE